MTRRKSTFRLVYLIFLAVLVVAVVAACLYVNGLLRDYEASQPERAVEQAVAELAGKAAGGDGFWAAYSLSEPAPGPYEAHLDVKAEYLSLLTSGGLSFSQQSGLAAEDELVYDVKSDGLTVAEVKLKAAGPAVTRLAVFSLREWTVEHVRPIFEPRDYTLTLPADFTLSVNGVALTAEDGVPAELGVAYTLPGLYLEPELAIADRSGAPVSYTIRSGRISAEYYDYTLTLPAALAVTVDGAPHAGDALEDGRVRHVIQSLEEPVVEISDLFGNTVTYEGGSRLPLTYMTVTAASDQTVRVNGAAVPDGAVTHSADPDYAHFVDYVEGLPQVAVYHIAVLEEGAAITVTDPDGTTTTLDGERTSHDLTLAPGLDEVPAEVAAQVDVLDIAQKWSLFMSNDLRFSQLSPYLISTSYQYDVAYRYATGIDITFTSSHILLSPAFTDISVTNFVWITEDCFSVDISFVKHMQLTRTGDLVDDPMNDRFYFVRYDDTQNGVDDPTWLLATMKEIVDDGE